MYAVVTANYINSPIKTYMTFSHIAIMILLKFTMEFTSSMVCLIYSNLTPVVLTYNQGIVTRRVFFIFMYQVTEGGAQW